MKNRILCLLLAIVMTVGMLGILASCGVAGGEYVSESGTTYEFSGSRFTYTMDKVTFKGTYKVKDMDGDKVIVLKINKRYYDGKELPFDEDDKESDRYIGGKTGVKFIEGDGYIVVDSLKYTKR